MQTFNQMAQDLISEMLPPVSTNQQRGNPNVQAKLQVSEDDLLDPNIANLIKQAKGDPTILAKLRPKLIQGMRTRRVAFLKQAQDELHSLR